MRIYLQTPPGSENAPRYHHLLLQKDLINGWSLVHESGRQGSPGRVTKKHFDEREAGVAALINARDAQLKRGFRVVFVKGD